MEEESSPVQSAPPIKAYLFLIVALLAPAVLYSGYLYWSLERSPVSRAALDQLVPGQSKTEVEAILGATHRVAAEERTWTYTQGWVTVYVYFDQLGRYRRYEIDG